MHEVASAHTVIRMLATLAALLAIGATAASVAPEMTALAIPVITALASLLALAVAAVLVAPGVAARFVRRGRLVPPATWRLAVVLAIGTVIVFPVNDRFYTEHDRAAADTRVGRCDGVVPLAEFVQNRLADDRHARWYYTGKCLD